ncbi:MAG TPA: o-succinylbenzoate--CoA ligase [Candidatus Hydrogenedens sp.]|nr:o-succinylbenzoate--CoA ligase [Candidatus Hydrogenedens sp.]
MFSTNIQDRFHNYLSYPLIKSQYQVLSFKEIWDLSDRYAKHLLNYEGCRVALLPVPFIETLILINSLIKLHAEIALFSLHEPWETISKNMEELKVQALFCPDEYLKKISDTPVSVISIKEIDKLNPSIPLKIKNTKRICENSVFIIMTSGSSASPKKVVLTLDNVLTNAHYSNRNLPFQYGDTWLMSLPLFHVSGLSTWFRAIESGGSVYLPDKSHRWWEIDLPTEITHISVVSTIMKRLLDRKHLSSHSGMKGILLGGGPIPGGIVRACYSMGLPLYTTYGLTEMASQTTTTSANDTLEHLLTAGKPLIPNTVQIEKDGTISVRGQCRFLGYLIDNEINQPFDKEGWFNTKDLGEWTSDNYLCISGRKDNVFICGGENIQPEEIENFIMSSGYVDKAVVIPVKDEEFGHIPVAFIKFNEGNMEKQLNNYLKEKVSGLKIPRAFYPFPEGFEEKNIKILRKELNYWINHIQKEKD